VEDLPARIALRDAHGKTRIAVRGAVSLRTGKRTGKKIFFGCRHPVCRAPHNDPGADNVMLNCHICGRRRRTISAAARVAWPHTRQDGMAAPHGGVRGRL